MSLDRAETWSADDRALYARVEDASINASATPLQLWSDGWLLRFSGGKAKRARCVHAMAIGRATLDEQLASVEAAYARQGMPLMFRITPFTQPSDLDRQLEERGFTTTDDTRVMVLRSLRVDGDPLPPPVAGHTIHGVGTHAFAQAVGALRGSSIAQQQAHAQRLEQSPLTWRAYVVRRDADGRTVAAGQVAVEASLVGVYDVHTDRASRRLGLATYLCRYALWQAALLDRATAAYLLVEADNTPARNVYTRLGFADAYRYHYRLRPRGHAGGA